LGHDDSSQPFVAGVYPMLPDETCFFLAIDFDKDGWQQDVRAFMDTRRTRNLPASDRARPTRRAATTAAAAADRGLAVLAIDTARETLTLAPMGRLP